MMQSVIEAQRL